MAHRDNNLEERSGIIFKGVWVKRAVKIYGEAQIPFVQNQEQGMAKNWLITKERVIVKGNLCCSLKYIFHVIVVCLMIEQWKIFMLNKTIQRIQSHCYKIKITSENKRKKSLSHAVCYDILVSVIIMLKS